MMKAAITKIQISLGILSAGRSVKALLVVIVV
jgi:hypothetical protein